MQLVLKLMQPLISAAKLQPLISADQVLIPKGRKEDKLTFFLSFFGGSKFWEKSIIGVTLEQKLCLSFATLLSVFSCTKEVKS